jgi:hypothetical protein
MHSILAVTKTFSTASSVVSLWNGFVHKCHMQKKSKTFVFVATDGRFMGMVKHSVKRRLPSHGELRTNPACWRFHTKNKHRHAGIYVSWESRVRPMQNVLPRHEQITS